MKHLELVTYVNIVGGYNYNPFLNSMIYEVELPDAQVKNYAGNIIAENMLSEVDDK